MKHVCMFHCSSVINKYYIYSLFRNKMQPKKNRKTHTHAQTHYELYKELKPYTKSRLE